MRANLDAIAPYRANVGDIGAPLRIVPGVGDESEDDVRICRDLNGNGDRADWNESFSDLAHASVSTFSMTVSSMS